MYSNVLKALAVSALVCAGGSAFAQSGNAGGVSGNGGVSGISGGAGIDFFASNAPGANVEKNGGLASSIEAAFTGTTSPSGTADAGDVPVQRRK